MQKLISVLALLSLTALTACGAAATDATAAQSEGGSVPATPSSQNPAASEEAPPPEASSAPEPQPVPTATVYYPLPKEVVQRIEGSSWQPGAPVPMEDLAYITVPFVDFAGETQTGEMVVHHTLAEEVGEIFTELYEADFPIEKMVLVDEYGADDLASMAANNSYCFCARLILGTSSYSVHSYGAALDINPVQNPYITAGEVYPDAAGEYLDRTDVRPGMVVENDVCYNAFASRGWRWGGAWQNPDYQHFEKDIGA